MTTIDVSNDHLTITLTGWDRVWTLRKQLSFPLSHVKSVEIQPRPRRSWKSVRFPGTYWPDTIQAGTFWSWDKHEWSFWNIRKADQVVIIELENERFRQVVLEVGDPDAVAERIRGASL
jgi:hypothetical protein